MMVTIKIRKLFGISGSCVDCGRPAVATTTQVSLGNLATPERRCQRCLELFASQARDAGHELTGDVELAVT